jgi:hypothetical protein
VDGRENVQGYVLVDGSDFFPHVSVEANSLHLDSYSRWCGVPDPW